MAPRSWLRSGLAPLSLTIFLLAFGAALRPVAAADGSGAAQFAEARRYENAEGVARDYAHALELYCSAARQGHADATYAIAWMYLNGRGVPHDDRVAAGWLKLAAERGNIYAPQMLHRLGAVEAAKPSGCKEPEPVHVVVPPAVIAKLVANNAAKYRVDPKLVLAVIATESAFQSDAVSSKNAQGLMQLIPETAQRFGVKNVFDPADNIRGGTMYLRWLLAHFRGNTALAIAAYNAGENAVDRYDGVPPYPETKAYVAKVRHLYAPAQHPYDLAALRCPSDVSAKACGG
jgi:soluble lytic murein transglycosylase-like protein